MIYAPFLDRWSQALLTARKPPALRRAEGHRKQLAPRMTTSDSAEAVAAQLPGLSAALEDRAAPYRPIPLDEAGHLEGCVAGGEQAAERMRSLSDKSFSPGDMRRVAGR